jgi:RNA 2',3'-cyclic 3'-phosphodiesterase
MPEKLRLFVAIFPSGGVVDALQKVVRELSANSPSRAVSWTEPEQIHLTLHFLGGVEREKLCGFEAALETVCKTAQAFPLRARGLGAFPGIKRPRIIWAGLRGALESLETLKSQLEPQFVELGYVPEKRPFHPHLTIGRVKEMNRRQEQSLARDLDQHRETDFGEWTVQRVDLMQSQLTPTGSRYTLVKSFNLAN